MELTCDSIENHVDAERREYCWRVRVYEERDLPTVVVAMPFPDPAVTDVAPMLDTFPMGAHLLLMRMDVFGRCCWWFEQEPGPVEAWSLAWLDAKAMEDLGRWPPVRLPARKPVHRRSVLRSIAPNDLDAPWGQQ